MRDMLPLLCACGVRAHVPTPYTYVVCLDCLRMYHRAGDDWTLIDGELPCGAPVWRMRRTRPRRSYGKTELPKTHRITRNGVEQARGAADWLQCRSCALVGIGYVPFTQQADGTAVYVHTDGAVWRIEPLPAVAL